jgi:membrane associated rhomboid family serine protease
MTPVTKKLLIINVAVFFAQILGADTILVSWFSVFPISIANSLQVWRLISYQFLHGGLGHILMNMIGVYFLGPTLERNWGSKRFLFFYLGCGAAGGLFYTILANIGFLTAVPMVGASGAVLGMLAACAILFPNFVVFFFLFPVPIRVAAIILIFISSVILITRGDNAGGEAAHLAGIAAGALYVFWPRIVKTRIKSRSSIDSWQKKRQQQQQMQEQVDRILEKVHNQGIHSLTMKEKRTLKKATKIHQRH